jgi:hypothetical protein
MPRQDPSNTNDPPAAPLPGFYIGYDNAVPKPLAQFLIKLAAMLLVALAAAAFLISRNINDPGNGDYGNDVTLNGTLIAEPEPVLRIAADDRHPPHAVMLAGEGKTGVQLQAATLSGTQVAIAGTLLRRGPIDMLVTAPQSIRPEPAHGPVPATPVSLGRWRLAGEICDGKCNTGAMRPGNGLAHKACANLCIVGGVPPVFVSTSPVGGATFFLLAGPVGATLPSDLYDLVALRVEVEGEIVKLDDLFILRTDLKTARKL